MYVVMYRTRVDVLACDLRVIVVARYVRRRRRTVPE